MTLSNEVFDMIRGDVQSALKRSHVYTPSDRFEKGLCDSVTAYLLRNKHFSQRHLDFCRTSLDWFTAGLVRTVIEAIEEYGDALPQDVLDRIKELKESARTASGYSIYDSQLVR